LGWWVSVDGDDDDDDEEEEEEEEDDDNIDLCFNLSGKARLF